MNNLEQLRDTILDIAAKNSPRSIPQHVVVSGDKGYGKSYFIDLLSKEADGHGYKTIGLRYPYYMVETADDVISRVEQASSSSIKRIIFIDDFDVLLQQLSRQEQYKLRAFLFADDAPMLVGTSTGIIEGFTDYRAPFYDAFRIFYLSNYIQPSLALFKENASETDTNIAEKYLGMDMRYLRVYADLLRTMDAQQAIDKMVSENYSHFRYILDSLPKLQQQTLSGIAMSDNEATSITIRELTGVEASSISASLLRLEKKGIITRIGEGKRNVNYSIKDRLLALWLKNILGR